MLDGFGRLGLDARGNLNGNSRKRWHSKSARVHGIYSCHLGIDIHLDIGLRPISGPISRQGIDKPYRFWNA
jgi:hypothetical protein